MKWITAGMNNEAGMKCNPTSKKRLTEYWWMNVNEWNQWMKDGLASLDWMTANAIKNKSNINQWRSIKSNAVYFISGFNSNQKSLI